MWMNKSTECPYPGCLNCILKKPEPQRSQELRDEMLRLHEGTEENDVEQRELWISSLRKTFNVYSEAKRQGRFVPAAPPSLFVRNGLIPCLLKVMQLDEPYLKPYSLEIIAVIYSQLLGIAHNHQNITDLIGEQIDLQTILADGGLLNIVEGTLFNGLFTERYQACKVLRGLFPDKNITSYAHQYNFQRLLEGVVAVTNTTLEQVIAETCDNRNTSWQVDVINPCGGTEWMRKYAPRYVEFVHEAAGMAINSMALAFIVHPERRLQVLQTPGFLSTLWKLVMQKPTEAYPDNITVNYYVETLHFGLATLPGEKPHPEFYQYLATVLTSAKFHVILEWFDKQSMDNMIPNLEKVNKYKPEKLPTGQEVFKAILSRGKVRPTLLMLINGLVKYTDMAYQFVLLAPRVEEYIRKLQMDSGIRRDVFYDLVEKSETWTHNDNKKIKWHLPGLMNLCLLFLLNLQQRIPSFTSNIPDLAELVKKQASKTKDEGNKEFQQKNFDIATFEYATAIELAELMNPPHPDLALFYSNRSECYLQLGMNQLALEDARKAVSLKPDHDKSLNRKDRAFEALVKQVD